MTVLLVIPMHAAETLAAFHQQQSRGQPEPARGYHVDMAQRCGEDGGRSRPPILAAGLTVDHQGDAVRRQDITTAQQLVDRHPSCTASICRPMKVPAAPEPAAPEADRGASKEGG
jgi:hypothetical protein